MATGWGRRLPPLMMGLVALALMVAVLPSSLHLPVTGPGSQAEVAPVPGQGNSQSNLSALGLAEGGTVGSGGGGAVADGAAPTPPASDTLLRALPPAGGTAQSAKCIGNPPRQTEDPLSPPCVPSWHGSPGGASYAGVSNNSINVVLMDNMYGHDGADYTQGSQANDDPYDTTARVLLRYFQNRFISYGRTVHLYHYRGAGQTPGGNQNLTYAELKQRYKPFAIVAETALTQVMTPALADGVMVFESPVRALGSVCGFDASDYAKYPTTAWCLTPDSDSFSRAYVNYICAGLAGRKATQATGALSTMTRKFGILSNGSATGGQRLAAALQAGCGVNATVYTYTSADYNTEAAKLAADGITSVLNPDRNIIAAAPRSNFTPEWIWNGGEFESQTQARNDASNLPPTEMAGSFGIVDRWRWRPNPQPYWYRAAQEVAPSATPDTSLGSSIYYGLLMTFTAIQRAGVTLNPQSVQAGLEGLTAADDLPWSPRASYSPGDHSYIDDFMIVRWDPSGHSPGASAAGCERLADDGRRYLSTGPWPTDDRAAATGAAQPCMVDETDASGEADINNS